MPKLKPLDNMQYITKSLVLPNTCYIFTDKLSASHAPKSSSISDFNLYNLKPLVKIVVKHCGVIMEIGHYSISEDGDGEVEKGSEELIAKLMRLSCSCQSRK